MKHLRCFVNSRSQQTRNIQQMLVQYWPYHLRRWSNITPTLGERLEITDCPAIILLTQCGFNQNAKLQNLNFRPPEDNYSLFVNFVTNYLQNHSQ